MANMSYCRFRNTWSDMQDCLEALCNEEKFSREEYQACKYMFEAIMNFLEDMDLIDVNQDDVDDWFEFLKTQIDDEE